MAKNKPVEKSTKAILIIIFILFVTCCAGAYIGLCCNSAFPKKDAYHEGDVITADDFTVRNTLLDIEIPEKYISSETSETVGKEDGTLPIVVYGLDDISGAYHAMPKGEVEVSANFDRPIYEGDTISIADFSAQCSYEDGEIIDVTVTGLGDENVTEIVLPSKEFNVLVHTTEGDAETTVTPVPCTSFVCSATQEYQPAFIPFDLSKSFSAKVSYADGTERNLSFEDVQIDWDKGSNVLVHGDNNFTATYKTMKTTGKVFALAEPIVQSEVFPMYYQDLDTTIEITKERHFDSDVYLAHVITKDPLTLKTTYSVNGLGYNEVMTKVAEYRDAILMINGVFDTHRCAAPIVREGEIVNYAGWPNNRIGDMLALNFDGHFYKMTQDVKTEMSENNLRSCWQFYTGMTILNGERIVKDDTARHPRTFIGEVTRDDGLLEYYLCVVDGRFEDSYGFTHDMESEILFERGCTIAYNLDGGGSTEMVFDGKIISRPSGGEERYDSDFIYVGRWTGSTDDALALIAKDKGVQDDTQSSES